MPLYQIDKLDEHSHYNQQSLIEQNQFQTFPLYLDNLSLPSPMNHTINSVRSRSSSDQLTRRSFRVIVKNRITHQNVQPEPQKSRSQIINVRNSLQNFDQAKNHLKKYIRNMKASSKQAHYESKQNTNRSSSSYIQKHTKVITSSRAELSSRKHNDIKAIVSTFVSPVQKRQSIRESFDESSKNQHEIKQYLNQDMTPLLYESNGKYRSVNESHQQGITRKLPLLRSALEQYEQPQNQTFYSQNIKPAQTSSRQRLCDLQDKIEYLLAQRLRIISSTDSFSSNQLQNRTAFKLLQKQMDRILFQIRRIKENQSSLNRGTIEHDLIEKDVEINRNIEMLEKKMKILERLIAEKLFESDNLKNQYLMKMKQHNRNKSQIPYSRKSQSSTFYRQVNHLQLSSFKPNKYEKQTLCNNDPTTNKADFKTPLKSYYISPSQKVIYSSNTLTQPLPRSTYNCQYLTYGVLPSELIRVKQTQKDHKIFANSMSANKQKHMLQGSTYKEDFISKKERDPVNFRQLDAYKDKLKSIQVNYGKERNSQKINNDHSVIDYYEDVQSRSKMNSKNKHRASTQNPQSALPILQGSNSKKSYIKIKLSQLARPTLQILNQTQKKRSMIEQQALQKNHLFHQRIKSQIKHKNVYDQKYKFKSELIKQKIKKHVDNNSLDEKIRSHQTLAY